MAGSNLYCAFADVELGEEESAACEGGKDEGERITELHGRDSDGARFSRGRCSI